MSAALHASAAAVSDIDPFSDAFLADPYPEHERLREAGPVVWLERYGVFAMARFAEVSGALADWETYISSGGVGLEDLRTADQWRPPSLLLEADPPEHSEARRLVTKVLTPVLVRELRQHFVEVAHRLVRGLVERTTFDGVQDLAVAYPMAVFPDAIGLQPDGRENLLPYAAMIFNGFGPRNRLYEESAARMGGAQRWVRDQARRGATDPDGIAGRIHALGAEQGLAPHITGGVVAALLAAGLDTTMHAIGSAVKLLAEHPDQWRRLREEPTRIRAAFEESIRLESPVQTFFRTTTRAVQVGDVTVPADSKVLLFLAAANRDPRRWEEPDRYDIGRAAGGHVGFGFGVHACVGQMLARLEGEAVLSALAAQVEELRIDGPWELDPNNTLRGLRALPLRVEPAVPAGAR